MGYTYFCDKFFREFDYDNDANLKDFGLRVNRGKIIVPARVLPPPNLQYANDVVQPQDGAWEMVREFMIALINRWYRLYYKQLAFRK